MNTLNFILEIGERNFYFCISKLNLTSWHLTNVNVDMQCSRNRPAPARRWKPVSSAADQVVEFLLRFKLLFLQLPKATCPVFDICLDKFKHKKSCLKVSTTDDQGASSTSQTTATASTSSRWADSDFGKKNLKISLSYQL